MADLGDLVARMMLDASGWAAGMKQAEADTAAGATAIEGALGGVTAGIGAMAGALGGIALSEKMLEFAESAMEASAQFGKFRTAITNMRGDGAEVTEFLDHVREIADKSPFAFPEMAGAAQRMVQLGGSLEDVTKTLGAVVDMGTALKMSAEQVEGITKAMGNLQAGMDPIRTMNQLVKQGVPAWQMLAEQTGQSIGEVKKAVKDGAISNKEVLDGLTDGMAKYHEAAEGWANGFKGSMKGLHDAVELSMKGIGDSIFQALNTVAAPVIQAVTKLVEKAGEVWGTLSGPIQTAVLAFGAIVAAVAPLVALWPVIEAGLATVAGAFAGPLIPIALLIAALVALGAWIGEHWEGITAILTTAWDSLVQIWGGVWDTISTALQFVWATIESTAKTVWGGITAFFTAYWDVLVSIWTGVWNAITTVLTTVWGALFSGAKGIFSPLTDWLVGLFEPVLAAWSKIAGFLQPILAKIGATGDVLSKAFSGLTEEMGKSVPAADKAAKSGQGVSASMDDTSKAAKEQTDKFKPLIEQNQILTAIYGKSVAAQKKLVDEIVALKLNQEKLTASGKTLGQVIDEIPEPVEHTSKAMEKLNEDVAKLMGTLKDGKPTVEAAEAALKDMGVESTRASQNAYDQAKAQKATVDAAGDMMSQYDKLAVSANLLKKEIEFLSKADGDNTAQLDALGKQLTDTTGKMDSMKLTTVDAYHQMGLKTADEMTALATNAQHAYEKIAADAGVNSIAAKEAWIKKTEETYTDILQQGGKLTEDQKTELAKQKQQVEDALKPLPGIWETAYTGIRDNVGKVFDEMVDKIVTGKGSFKEIITGLWQDIATTALNAFIAPLKKAVSDFVAKELAGLLSGLGSVSSTLTEIGGKAASTFPSGGDFGGEFSGGGVPGTGGTGGGGGTGGVASAASAGLTGWISAISGAVTAISSVIGNFQMAHMETSLNAIEHNTRYTMMYVGERADGGILGVLFKIDEEIAWGTQTKATEKLRDLFLDWSGPALATMTDLLTLAQNSTAAIMDIATVLMDMREITRSMADGVQAVADVMSRDGGGRNITVSVTTGSLTTGEAARALGNQIAENLSRQLVAVS